MNRSAILSDDLVYRYQLTRIWDETKKVACFVMLNPSTADANIDDPTIRRCVGFATKWGYGGIVVVNLAAFRATDPDKLSEVEDPVGPENLHHVETAISGSEVVVAAWGNVKLKFSRGACQRGMSLVSCAKSVVTICESRGKRLRCLGKTSSGQPRHPLYVHGDKELEEWGHE